MDGIFLIESNLVIAFVLTAFIMGYVFRVIVEAARRMMEE